MSTDREDLVANYAAMSEPDLMQVARSYDSLTDAAKGAIRAEFSRRKLEPPLIEEMEPDEVPAERNLITVRRYRDLTEALVARSLLESAGIVTYLRDENLMRLDWPLSNMIGGVRLQVEAGDDKSAEELLNQPVPATIQLHEGEEFNQPRCPACGSADITFQGASRGAALPSLLVLGLPLPTGRETWSCDSCGTRWEDTEG